MTQETATWELRGDGNQLVVEIFAIKSQVGLIVRNYQTVSGSQIDQLKLLIDEAKAWAEAP